MSINKFQEKVFRTGCGSAVLFACAAVFFGGMFYYGCGLGGGLNNSNATNEQPAAFKIGDTPISYQQFSTTLQSARDQQKRQSGRQSSPDALSAEQEASIEAELLNEYVTSYGNIYLAKKAGVKFTDDQITQVFSKQVETGIAQDRTDLVSKKKLKPDATAAEFDAALKLEKRPTATERRKEFHDDIAKALKDEKTRPGLEEQTARDLLLDALQASIKPTIDELKATYSSYQFKRILFTAHPGATVDSEIVKAQADLKAGQSFEQVIDRYSSEPPLKGKKLSENTIDLLPAQFDMIPEYKSLKNMKQGQVSDPIETPQGKSIYKLVAVKSTAPPDLEKNPDKYIKMFAQQKAETQYDDQMKKFTQSGPITWNQPGLKALYDWFQVRQDFMLPPAERTAKFGAVVDEAKAAMKSSNNDPRAAALAWYAAFDSIWSMPTTDKVKLRADRIAALQAVTSIQPFFPLKMELVDLLVASKAADEAVTALKAAASSNFSYDIEGQQNFQEIAARIIKLKAAGMLKNTDEADLAKLQQDWLKGKESADQDKAEMKKEQEAAKKEADENAAKQKAATEKQKAEAAKAGALKTAAPGATSPAGAKSPVTAPPSAGKPSAPPVTPPPAGKK